MRLGKKVLFRPKCENCGARIYRIHGPIRRYFWGKIPSHCPNCGQQISLDVKNQLDEHDALLWLISCTICVVFIIIIVVIL